MRTRTRSITTNISGLLNQTETRIYDPPSSLPPERFVTISKITASIVDRNETISDSITARPEVIIDPKTGKWKRIKYHNFSKYELPSNTSRLFRQNRPFRPVQACTHTKTVYDLKDSNREFVVVAGGHYNNWTTEMSLTYANPYIAAYNLTGSSSVLSTAFNGASAAYSAGAYKKIDWFALAHDFTEACDSFTKNKFLAGEALYECEIFVSAFKLITNPASAISTLAKYIRHGLSRNQASKYRRMNLGQFARHVKGFGKKGIDLHLSYDFGVKPAIADTIATISAHDFVSRRLRYLSQHSGSFIPIRVRQQLSAGISNAPPASLAPGVRSRLFRLVEDKTSLGVISGWGRVRQDLDWNDTWSAYMQYFGVGKLIGLAWELIPFSFLIDWVSNAQEFIDNQTRLRTGGPFIGVKGISASLKEYTRESLSLNPGYISSIGLQISNPVNPVKIGYRTISSFSRYTKIPETSGLVDFSNLGSFHYTKLAELIVQLLVK